MKDIFEKYRNGDKLTDREVLEGLNFFRNLAAQLYRAGPYFVIAAEAANRVYIGLDGYARARNLAPIK